MITVTSPSGSAAPPTVSKIPCTYRANCHSALLKHRVRHHKYVTDPNGSRRRDKPTTSRVDRRAKASPYVSTPLLFKKTTSSNDGASYSASAYPTVASPSSSMVQPLDNEHYAAQDTRHGEVWNNNPYDLAAKSSDANSLVASQDYYTHHDVAAGACPILPNDPAMDPVASRSSNSYNPESAGSYFAYDPSPAGPTFDNRFSSHPTTLHGEASNGNAFTFARDLTNANLAIPSQYHRDALPFPLLPNSPPVSHYDSESLYTSSNDSTHTSPDLLHNTTSLPSPEEPITPEAESTDSGSVATYTSNYGSSTHSYTSFSSLPVEIPFDNSVYADANPSVTQKNNSTDVALLEPTPLAAPETLVDDYDSFSATDIMPSFSDFETEFHEDDIFYRGTGREGCLCPEMMINAGVEGWDGSLMNTQQQEYYPYY